MVDLAAAEVGIDNVELRRRNYVSPKEMPFKTGLTFTYDCGEFEKNMDLAMDLADLDGFDKRRKDSRKAGKLRGIGLSNTIERAAAPGTEGAEVRFDRSGGVTMFAGSNSQGQGHETVFKQIVADKLGIHPDDIRYVQGDTDQVFYGEGTGGSRSATMGGTAFSRASDKVIEKAARVAAHALQVDPADIKFADGVFSSAKSNRTMTMKEVAADAHVPAKLPAGMEPGLAATAVHTTPVNNYPNGCHICEVEIDMETGETVIVRYSVVDDVGTVLNPMLLHGQIHGGVAQGAGQALMEDIHFDASGQLVTASFMDYAMPRAHNLSAMHVEANPVPTKTNPLGTKGAGEAGCVGALPAVVNAVVDALKEFGIRHIEMPATPERIWRAMQTK
jgi:carbon-monoxide dehydrogenase large subunit